MTKERQDNEELERLRKRVRDLERSLGQMRESLNASEERLRSLYSNSPIGMAFIGTNGVIEDCNEALARIIGAPRERLIGYPMQTGIKDEAVAGALARAFTGAIGAYEGDYTTVTSGKTVPLSVLFVPLLDGAGQLKGVLSLVEDITERRRMERDLRESEGRYKAIVESQAEFVVRYLPGGVVTFANDTLCTYAGLKREDLIGNSYYHFMHPDDRDAFVRQIEALDRAHPRMTAEARVVLPDGRITWHRWTHQAIFDTEGRISEYQCTGRDITEQREAAERLRESEVRYRTLFDSMDAAVLLMRGAECVACNPATLKLFGLSRKEEIIGKTPLDFAPPKQPDGRDSAELVHWNVEQALAKGFHIFEWQAFRKSGEPVSMEVRFTPYRVGEEQYFQCIAIDITERKRAEERLRTSEEKYRALIETTSTGFVILDEQGRVLDANDAYVRMTGRGSQAAILGRSVVEWTAEHDRERNAAEVKKCLQQGSVRDLEIDYVHGDGTFMPIEINATVLRSGATARILALCRDITARRLAEGALRESEERYRQLFEAESDAIFLIDNNTGRLMNANSAAAALYGYTLPELLALSNRDLSAEPSETRRVTEQTPVVQENMVTIPLRYHRRKDGTVFPVEITGRFFEYQGRPVHIAAIRDISARMQAEQKLRESESRLRTVTENAPDTILQVDRKGVITFVNRLLPGLTEEMVIGSNVARFVPEEQGSVVARALEQAFVTGQRQEYESTGPGPHGEPRYYSIRVMPVLVGERPESAIFIATDITMQKQAERETAERTALLQQILDTASVAIFLVDRQGHITHANRRMAEMFMCPMEELLGSEYVAHVHPSERETGRQKMLALLASEIDSVDLERYYWRTDGSEFWGHLVGRRFYDTQGNEIGLVGVIADIDKRKRAEEALRKSEQTLQAIIDAEPDCIKITDRESRVILMNRAGLAMVEADSPDQVQGQRICTLVAPSYRESFAALTEKVFQGGSGTLEFQITGLKGRSLWMETFAVPLWDENQNVRAMLGVTRDVTERKQAEQALRKSEERFRDLAASLPLTVFEMDLQGRFIYVNSAALDTFGYTQKDIENGLYMDQVIAPEDRERAREVMRRRLSGDMGGYVEYRGIRKNGSTLPISVASSPILHEGRPVGLRGIVTDLTERMELEDERFKKQRIESIGTLAGGIAHDFNNLLQGIFGYISMAKLTMDQKEKSLAMLTQAEKALHQAVGLTSQLLTFSKGGKPVRKRTALDLVIENAAKFALSGSRSGLRLDIDPGLRQSDVDAGQIGQVIQNIVLNADQAMPLGGTVTITARNIALPEAGAPTGLRTGDYVVVAVRDEGVGIAPKYLERIFDPYFTTKEKGSGLGLATSYSIIKNHDGAIDVSSSVGSGTTFRIFLPAAGAAGTDQPGAREGGAERKGRVLVMDDEEVVRAVATEMLASLGQEVHCVEHGAAAIDAYRAAMGSGRPFDVVILDLTIRGGMGGLEAFRNLRDLDPAVKAVVSSGYSDDATAADYQKLGFRAFLKKPYGAAELQDVLNECLSDGGARFPLP